MEEVLRAAGTKWNFHIYQPGLVGGHCIPVEPYYLTYLAKELGIEPQVILAGRHVNDSMPVHVAKRVLGHLEMHDIDTSQSNILVLGVTFKENVPDTRTSPVKTLLGELKSSSANVIAYDPLIPSSEIEGLFQVNSCEDLSNLKNIDAIIVTVAHSAFEGLTVEKLAGLCRGKPILFDVRGMYNQTKAIEAGFKYLTL